MKTVKPPKARHGATVARFHPTVATLGDLEAFCDGYAAQGKTVDALAREAAALAGARDGFDRALAAATGALATAAPAAVARAADARDWAACRSALDAASTYGGRDAALAAVSTIVEAEVFVDGDAFFRDGAAKGPRGLCDDAAGLCRAFRRFSQSACCRALGREAHKEAALAVHKRYCAVLAPQLAELDLEAAFARRASDASDDDGDATPTAEDAMRTLAALNEHRVAMAPFGLAFPPDLEAL